MRAPKKETRQPETRQSETSRPVSLEIDTSLLRPGLRLVVGVSGGADSVALLRALHERSVESGLVLHVAHLHHGLRGAEADQDLEFVRALADQLGLPLHEALIDVGAEAAASHESIEEAARRLRYGWFRRLMAEGRMDAVATGHTLDDQAETVCGKFLRGAWTEGLGGIHPVVEFAEGRIVRPLLRVKRSEVESYLDSLGQPWREDSSNREAAFTRNRLRHELLPVLEGWNPRLKEHLAQMAELARDEEAWWATEVARLAPQLLLAGKPVRGGGRASGEGLALDVVRLAAMAPALQRRMLRYAAERMGSALDFQATEALRALALEGRAGQRRALPRGLRAERTPRELRLSVEAIIDGAIEAVPVYEGPVPGQVVGAAFGVRLRIEVEIENATKVNEIDAGADDSQDAVPMRAVLRNWRAGDRVRLRHSSGPRKVKEVLERLRVTGQDRAIWPVLEIQGRIAWMKGVDVETESGIAVTAVNWGGQGQTGNGATGGLDVNPDDTFE